VPFVVKIGNPMSSLHFAACPLHMKIIIKRNQFTDCALIEAGNTIEERRRKKFKKAISTNNTVILFRSLRRKARERI
jgi:hypothetical protein